MRTLTSFSVLTCSFVLAQEYRTTPLYSDDFSSPGASQWNVGANSTYVTEISNGEYICYLPPDNRKGWNWTYVGVPRTLRSLFNSSSEITLSFDFTNEIIDPENHVGFMFDLHNVDDSCPGGDFYGLDFYVSAAGVTPWFHQAVECNTRTVLSKTGMVIPTGSVTHVEIHKVGSSWNVLVNDEVSLQLSFTGDISMDRLKFGKGQYSLDNFLAYSTEIDLEPPPQRPQPPTVSHTTSTPKIWAVCVGVQDYTGYPGYPKYISNLSACVADARSYRSFLASTGGGAVPSEQVILLSNAQAGRSDILAAAQRLFSRASTDDLIVLFLSGHGSEGAYCASDGLLRYEDINKVLRQSNAKRKLLIADACHSGTWASAKETFAPKSKQLDASEALELFYSELKRSGDGITYLLAAQPDEVSWEVGNSGLFTKFLIDGMSCGAKSGTNPIITCGDLSNYLTGQIVSITSGPNFKSVQHPFLQGDRNMPVAVCP